MIGRGSLVRRIRKLEKSLSVRRMENPQDILMRVTDADLQYLRGIWEAACRLFGEKFENNSRWRQLGQSRLQLVEFWVGRYSDVYTKLLEGAHVQRLGARFNEDFLAAMEDPILGELAKSAKEVDAARP